MNSFNSIALGLLVVAGVTGQSVAYQEVVELTVTGQGITEDSARRDALRKALEQGGQVEISSHSNVQNFELIRDSIYARAEGIVTDYKVLEQGDGAGGVKYCKIVAKVSKSAIASTWGAVQNVLDQLGRPGVAVYILERIDGIVQDSSILESQIENRLLKSGFKVYAGEHLRELAKREGIDAQSEGDVKKLQAVAKDFGTQIFITGTAQANAAGVKDLFGEPTAMYNGDGMIKMYYTDSGQLVASESLPNWRGGARGYHTISPQAGKQALENAGQELVERCYQSVMEHWATQISSGGEISLEISGMPIADGLKLKQKLRDIDPDKIVTVHGPSMTKDICTFRIQAKMSAEELAEYLVRDPWAQIIEITDLKSNRIQAKKAQGKP